MSQTCLDNQALITVLSLIIYQTSSFVYRFEWQMIPETNKSFLNQI